MNWDVAEFSEAWPLETTTGTHGPVADHRCPAQQGSNFQSQLLQELYRLLRVRAIRTSPELNAVNVCER